VIRLVSQHTVDEIILRRAAMKLRLTRDVVEEGGFSNLDIEGEEHETLQSVITFGLAKIFQQGGAALQDDDIETILSRAQRGEQAQSVPSPSQHLEEGIPSEPPQSMYEFEGKDYRDAKPEVEREDAAALEQIVAEAKKAKANGEAVEIGPAVGVAQRTKKDKAAALEAKKRREEAKRRKWEQQGYTSGSILLDLDALNAGLEAEQSSNDDTPLHYTTGDASSPCCSPAVVINCVDNSGNWGKRGFFAAISSKSNLPGEQYQRAAQYDDVHLGDAHLCEIAAGLFVANLVVQSRSKGEVSGIKLKHLETALQKVAMVAREQKLSVHMPRIGAGLPGFNWYATERLLRDTFAARSIACYIYYFKRDKTKQIKPAKQDVKPVKQDPKPELKRKLDDDDDTVPMAQHQRTAEDDNTVPVTLPARSNNFFDGLRFFFNDCEHEDELKQLVIGHGGTVASEPDAEVTHVVSNDRVEIVQHAKCVRAGFIRFCVQQQQLGGSAMFEHN
jgi:hypothetical protein